MQLCIYICTCNMLIWLFHNYIYNRFQLSVQPFQPAEGYPATPRTQLCPIWRQMGMPMVPEMLGLHSYQK